MIVDCQLVPIETSSPSAVVRLLWHDMQLSEWTKRERFDGGSRQRRQALVGGFCARDADDQRQDAGACAHQHRR